MRGADRRRWLRIAWIVWTSMLAPCASLPANADDAAVAASETTTLTLDPQASEIHFEVGATLHRVEGTARFVSGTIHFDPAGGPASGDVEVDAASFESGNSMRDKRLHADVLDSQRYPRIVFRPSRLVVSKAGATESEVQLEGAVELHGGSWPLSIPATVHRTGDRVEFDARFPVPYVEWGLENPGNFLLKVDDVVQVRVHATGTLAPAAP